MGNNLFPLIESWGTPARFPERFDQQGTCDLTAWLAAATAFDEVEEQLGWSIVRDYATTLADYGHRVIGDAMSDVIGNDARAAVGMPVGPMRLIALPKQLAGSEEHAQELRNAVLDQVGIACAFTYFRGAGYLRIAAHAYNTVDDYDDVARRVVPLVAQFGRTR